MRSSVYFAVALFPWLGFFLFPIHNLFSVAGAVLASLLLCLALNWAGQIREILKTDLAKPVGFSLAFIAIIQILQICIHFPGLISGDDLGLMGALMQGIPSYWNSLSYSLITLAAHFIFFSPVCLSIFNGVLTVFVAFLFFRLLPRRQSLWSLIVTTLLFCSPQVSVLVLFQNRDSMNSLLLTWICLALVAQRTDKNKEPWFNSISIFALMFLLADMRQEGKIYLLLVPLCFFVSRRMAWRQIIQSSFMIFAVSLFLFLPLAESYSIQYSATVFINPLSAVLHEKGLQEASPQEQEELNHFFKVPYLIDFYNPIEIDAFHHQGIRENVTQKDFEGFRRASLQIISRNLPVYFENRRLLALTALNFEGRPYAYGDDLANLTPESKPVLEWFHIPMKSPEHNLYQALSFSWFDFVFYRLPEPLRTLFSSCLIPLLSLFFLLFCWQKYPELFFPSFILLVRTGLVLLTAPAAYFKYISSVWLVGWLLLIYFFAWRTRPSTRPSEI